MQGTVTTSTTEQQMSAAAQEAIFMSRLLKALHVELKKAVAPEGFWPS